MKTSPCGVAKCENPARFFPSGWYCAPHGPRPVNPTPDPNLTADALRDRSTQT